jgi:hypothetical protein
VDTPTLLRLFRDTIVDTDPSTDLFQDTELMVNLADALRVLQSKRVAGMSSYSFDLDPASLTFGVNPNPTDPHGLIIMLKAAVDLLNTELLARVRSGEIGVSWQSGLEQESSISAAKSYQTSIDALENELECLLVIQNVDLGRRSQ